MEVSPDPSASLFSKMPLPPLPRKKRRVKPTLHTVEDADAAQGVSQDILHIAERQEGVGEQRAGFEATAANEQGD